MKELRTFHFQRGEGRGRFQDADQEDTNKERKGRGGEAKDKAAEKGDTILMPPPGGKGRHVAASFIPPSPALPQALFSRQRTHREAQLATPRPSSYIYRKIKGVLCSFFQSYALLFPRSRLFTKWRPRRPLPLRRAGRPYRMPTPFGEATPPPSVERRGSTARPRPSG